MVASVDQSAAAPGRRRDLLEIGIAYGLILLVIWTPRPWQQFLWILAAAFIVVVTWASSDDRKAMGLRAANLLRSSWVVAVALGVAAVAFAVSARLHTLRLPAGPVQFVGPYVGYAIWSFGQQFLLQAVFLSRLLRLTRKPILAAITAAVIFSAAHLPNPILAPVTLLLGLAACLIFLRYRNLYSLALAHAIIGVTIATTVPGPVSHNMRVGLSYLVYRHPRPAPLPPRNPSPQP